MNGLVKTAVHPDGFLGYVQGGGSNPASSQPVTYESNADFGVGAFLLAGSEVYKLAGGQPVPVEFAFFAGYPDRGDAVRLVWTTCSESDNYGFAVEKLIDTSWKEIGFVKGHGTSSLSHNYEFIDNVSNALPGDTTVTYRLKQIDGDGSFDYSAEMTIDLPLPETTRMVQNYPNPFNPATTFEYQLAYATHVSLKVFNLSGQEIATLVDEVQVSGRYQKRWEPEGLASGVYLYRLTAGEFSEVRRLIYVR